MSHQPAVFIATLGNAPQVITLALDHLMAQGIRFAEVCILHTDDRPGQALHGATEAVDREFRQKEPISLTPVDKRWQARYVYQNQSYPLTYRRVCLHVEEERPFQFPAPIPVQDVETERNVQATFRVIFQVVRDYISRQATVHFSIAGGRKSMAVFGMATAQLCFGPNDKLWHVVSREAFMNTKAMHDNGRHATLVPIPFIRLGNVAPVVSTLITSNNPTEIMEAQSQVLSQIDLSRKAAFMDSLNFDEKQILIGVTQGLKNEEIGELLQKPLAGKTVANKLSLICEKYLHEFDILRPEADHPTGERMRTFLAAHFGAYCHQQSWKLPTDSRSMEK